jgi:signal transduction histidine kinase/ActR/RegA family two-component response regulator
MCDPRRENVDIERLRSLSDQLACATSARAAARAAIAVAVSALDATSGVVALVTEDGDRLALLDRTGERHPAFAEIPELPLDGPFPIAHAALTGETVHLGSRDDLLARFPAMADTPQVVALACAPMVVDGRRVGALGVAFDAPRSFDERDLDLLRVIAQQCALAAERARLRDVERAARNAELLRDEHLARVSHELRTPLAALRMWIQVLRSGSVEDRRAAIDAIDRSAIAQSKLIEDLLDFARGVNGKLRIDRQIVDARGPIEEALNVMRPEAEAKSILLLAAVASDAAYVLGDPGRLQQVVVNLLGNAIKFTPSGGRIEVLLRADPRDVLLSVSDTGAGLDPEGLDGVFDPFWQGERHAAAQGGLGLGLTIARHLVSLHEGTIHAESRGEGAGATFVVRLPRIPEDQVAPTPSRSTLRAESGSKPLAGLRVLIVEDHAPSRDALLRVLESVGAEAVAAASAREAREILSRSPIGVIVSDLAMPDEDGWSFLERLRAHGLDTPAVALTAHARPEDAARAIAAGFQEHVAKPADSARIVDVVAQLAGRSARSTRRERPRSRRPSRV